MELPGNGQCLAEKTYNYPKDHWGSQDFNQYLKDAIYESLYRKPYTKSHLIPIDHFPQTIHLNDCWHDLFYRMMCLTKDGNEWFALINHNPKEGHVEVQDPVAGNPKQVPSETVLYEYYKAKEQSVYPIGCIHTHPDRLIKITIDLASKALEIIGHIPIPYTLFSTGDLYSCIHGDLSAGQASGTMHIVVEGATVSFEFRSKEFIAAANKYYPLYGDSCTDFTSYWDKESVAREQEGALADLLIVQSYNLALYEAHLGHDLKRINPVAW